MSETNLLSPAPSGREGEETRASNVPMMVIARCAGFLPLLHSEWRRGPGRGGAWLPASIRNE